MQRPRDLITSLFVGAVLALAGCGEGEEAAPAMSVQRDRSEPAAAPPAPRPPECEPSADNCAEAAGKIVYVERIDPDGDGDAHFVLLDSPGVTGPGISVVDVAADLRPKPLPEPGELLAAAGPVYEGSFGQRQIQATAVTSARAAR